MTPLLIQNAQVATPAGTWERGWLLVEDTRITQMDQGTAPTIDNIQIIDGNRSLALPGFIDVHVHGAAGYDTMDANPQAIQEMARFYARCGVTSFLATTMTADHNSTQHALENVVQCMGPIQNGATVLGVHLEGPYINVAMKGAQFGPAVRLADPEEYLAWLDLNVIKQVTVAPEFPENQHFIGECVARNVNVSIGHTQATYEDVIQAVNLGARQATHTFNAMVGVHHRKPGTAGAVLTIDEIDCELIPDNIHVHPAILKLAIRAKGTGGIILITDAIRGTGMGEGRFELGGQPVTVFNGMATLADGTLAGSILTMDRAVQNVLAATGLSLSELWPMTSANAAARLGIADRKGCLAVGYDADIVLLNASGNVQLTVVEGQIAYQNSI